MKLSIRKRIKKLNLEKKHYENLLKYETDNNEIYILLGGLSNIKILKTIMRDYRKEIRKYPTLKKIRRGYFPNF